MSRREYLQVVKIFVICEGILQFVRNIFNMLRKSAEQLQAEYYFIKCRTLVSAV